MRFSFCVVRLRGSSRFDQREFKPESGKLTVLVSLFERETQVELSFDQVTTTH